MYGRKVGERTLTFGHEGMLYRKSFVMYDKETNSKWVHVTGEAIKGELKGRRLPFVPSEVVTWKEWRRRHPETLVLLGRRARGHMGRFGLGQGLQHYGLSVGEGRAVRLYPYPLLRDRPVFNTTWGKEPLLIVFDATSLGTAAFMSRVGEKTLTFEAHGAAGNGRDRETRSAWNLRTGIAVGGALAGQALERLPATPWLVERWKGFFPDGEIVRKER